MKARYQIESIRLNKSEFKTISNLHKSHAKGLELSTFCREVLINSRIHPYAYVDSYLMDKPLGLEDSGKIRNKMEFRYHVKCELMAAMLILLEQNNMITEAIAKNRPLYNKLLDQFRGYSINQEDGSKELMPDQHYNSYVSDQLADDDASFHKRSTRISIRFNADEYACMIKAYCSGPYEHKLKLPEWIRQVLTGKIPHTDLSSYHENIYEVHKRNITQEPILPGFQTYLHYESQILASLVLFVKHNDDFLKTSKENSEKLSYLIEMICGYSIDPKTHLKTSLDYKFYENFDHVIHAGYYSHLEKIKAVKRKHR